MPYVIAAACIDVMDRSCMQECPVDCIYEGERKLYINPVECIDCGACEPACPVSAITQDRRVPADQREFVGRLVEEHGNGLPVRLAGDARAALLHARASVVASGTATVEAALIGNPFVVVYRVSPVTYAIAERVVSVPHVAMANLIAGKRVVPELIQKEFTASNIVRYLEPLLPDGPRRQSMMKELAAIRALLLTRTDETNAGGAAIGRVARITLDLLDQRIPARVEETAHF